MFQQRTSWWWNEPIPLHNWKESKSSPPGAERGRPAQLHQATVSGLPKTGLGARFSDPSGADRTSTLGEAKDPYNSAVFWHLVHANNISSKHLLSTSLHLPWQRFWVIDWNRTLHLVVWLSCKRLHDFSSWSSQMHVISAKISMRSSYQTSA